MGMGIIFENNAFGDVTKEPANALAYASAAAVVLGKPVEVQVTVPREIFFAKGAHGLNAGLILGVWLGAIAANKKDRRLFLFECSPYRF